MTPRVRKADAATIEGRLRKAAQFMEAAETIRDLADDERDVGDAYVTLCIHAGIAAADVVCSTALGEHVQGGLADWMATGLTGMDDASSSSMTTPTTGTFRPLES